MLKSDGPKHYHRYLWWWVIIFLFLYSYSNGKHKWLTYVKINSQTKKSNDNKRSAAIQRKYLSVDQLPLQQTQMSKTLIWAFDPPSTQPNSLQKANKRLYGCFEYLWKDTAFSVENIIQCSHMFIAPATPFSLTINNQTCHPEQTKLERAGGEKNTVVLKTASNTKKSKRCVPTVSWPASHLRQ